MPKESVQDRKLYLLMANLLYPAVHGTLLYTLLQVSVERFSTPLEPAVLARRSVELVFLACLLVHFAIDYLYTVINEHKPEYGVVSFVFDAVIVGCLFLAGSAVLPKANDPIGAVGWLTNPAIWLVIGKVAGALWEWRLRREDPTRSRFGMGSDVYFALLYAWLAFTYPTAGLGPIFAVLIFDTAAYFVHPVFHPARKPDPAVRCACPPSPANASSP